MLGASSCRRKRRIAVRGLGIFVVVAGCLASSTGQTAPPSSADSKQPKDADSVVRLRVATHLVQLNVIVNDKHGNPETGLTEKDFSIFDNGKRQQIRNFSVETNSLATSTAVSPAPGNYTNRPLGQNATANSVTVILLDALNTEIGDQKLARDEVLRVLREREPQEYIALYRLSDELEILHDFTNDPAALRRVLAASGNKSSSELDNSELGDPSLSTTNPSTPLGQSFERQKYRLAFAQREANASQHDRVRETAAAMILIAHHLGVCKGRKNLVWVSSSFPISVGYDKADLNWTNDTGGEFGPEVQRAAQALTDANIAVYPVDARGLVGADNSAAGTAFSDEVTDPTDPDTHVPTRAAPETFDTMRVLAESTGGRAFYGTNNIAGAIRHAMEDARVTYTLEYYPSKVKWDGSFHEIKVKVDRPGAEVRARKGYFAIADSVGSPVKGIRETISELAESHLPATGIGLQVAARPTDPGMLTTQVHLELHEIGMQEQGDRWMGTVESVFLQMDGRGRIVQADDRTFHPEFDGKTYAEALRVGISDSRQVKLLPNAVELCVVVRDPVSGRMGSIYIPLGASAETDRRRR